MFKLNVEPVSYYREVYAIHRVEQDYEESQGTESSQD